MNRIEKIRMVAQQREQERENEKNAVNMQVALLRDKILKLQPRIKVLVEIGEELLANGIPFGEPFRWVGFTYYKLETDGIHHHFGYKCKWENGRRTRVIGIGIEGGGACGPNFYVDKNGVVIDGPFEEIKENTAYAHILKEKAPGRFISRATRFLESFRSFEKAVFEYVDTL